MFLAAIENVPPLPRLFRTLSISRVSRRIWLFGYSDEQLGLKESDGHKAFDSNAIIADLDARGAKVVISQHPRRAKPLAIDEQMYKWRHLIENFFKEFKRIAMRADKTDQSFASMIHLAAAVINSR
jgi:hypothetical protein